MRKVAKAGTIRGNLHPEMKGQWLTKKKEIKYVTFYVQFQVFSSIKNNLAIRNIISKFFKAGFPR